MSLEKKDEYDHKSWMKTKDLSPIETTFLTVLIWLDQRLRIVDYLEILEDLYYKVNMQMPKSHTEQYNLDNKFWYWYPLYALGSFSTIAYVVAAISGALLGFYYSPATTGDPSTAYNSITFIMTDLRFGFFLVHDFATEGVDAQTAVGGQPRHDGRPRWHAHGAVGVGARVVNAGVRQPVEVWRENVRIASGVQGVEVGTGAIGHHAGQHGAHAVRPTGDDGRTD